MTTIVTVKTAGRAAIVSTSSDRNYRAEDGLSAQSGWTHFRELILPDSERTFTISEGNSFSVHEAPEGTTELDSGGPEAVTVSTILNAEAADAGLAAEPE